MGEELALFSSKGSQKLVVPWGKKSQCFCLNRPALFSSKPSASSGDEFVAVCVSLSLYALVCRYLRDSRSRCRSGLFSCEQLNCKW